MIRRFPKLIGLCSFLDLEVPGSYLEFYKIVVLQQIERNRLYIVMRSESLSLPGFLQTLVSLPRLLGAGALNLNPQGVFLKGKVRAPCLTQPG